ncbi:MAG: type II secretion system F family protein [Candidatus Pacearchaeota archaeon]
MKYEKNKRMRKKIILMTLTFAIAVSLILFFIYKKIAVSTIGFILTLIIIYFYFYFSKSLAKSNKIRKLESIFPDFLQLMSSNLKAGMTIDRAMLLSSRPEFAPLDAEILSTGKDIATGKDIEQSFLDMSKRIDSQKIHKVILLIISGIRAGGDLAVLLEQTSTSMRQRELLEKKASSNIAMYFIFILIAVSFAAPALFSLSTVLVELMSTIFSEVPATPSNLPFTLSKINISISFVNYFSVVFIVIIDILACLILGLINKGEEKQGLRYLPFILIISLAVFFIAKGIISNFMGGLF